jgi:hypothetical protein
MSKVAAAITSPATKAAKQENSTKSLRSIRIRAPSPLLRGLRLASKRLIVAKDRARRHRVEAEGLGLSFRALAGLAQNEEPGRSGGEAGGLTPFESAKPMDGSANLLCCCRYSTKTRIKQPLQCAVEFAHLIISPFGLRCSEREYARFGLSRPHQSQCDAKAGPTYRSAGYVAVSPFSESPCGSPLVLYVWRISLM